MEVLTNNRTFFNDLKRIAKSQELAKNTRMPSIANTLQPETRIDNTLISMSKYSRKWQQEFSNPFPIKSRFDSGYYNGRNLNILNTLKFNAKIDNLDVMNSNSYRFIGFT